MGGAEAAFQTWKASLPGGWVVGAGAVGGHNTRSRQQASFERQVNTVNLLSQTADRSGLYPCSINVCVCVCSQLGQAHEK